MGGADLLVLKASCERCGGASDLYGTGCRHTTLCCSCARTMARSCERCAVCTAPITSLIREYNVSVDTAAEKTLSIGRFTTGLPPFSDKENAGSCWSLLKEGQQGQQLTGNIRDKDYNKMPWILEDETGQYQYQGQVEGLQSTASTYYLLMLHGKELRAFPVGSWYNFSKISHHRQLTLEEAEERMNRRRNTATGYEGWMMKTATNGAAAFCLDVTKLDDANEGETSRVHLKKGNKNEDGLDKNKSDKGNEDKREDGPTTKGMEEEEERGKYRDFDLNVEIEKGDDWEHEEIFTDDDEAVDIDLEEISDLADHEVPAPPEIKQNDNENGRGLGLSKSGKELKRLLRHATRQNESEDEEDMDEDESLSSAPSPKQKSQIKSEPGKDNPSKPTAPEHLHCTPFTLKSVRKGRRGRDAKTSNGATPKKPKIEPGAKTVVVKEETLPSLEKASKPFASASSGTNASPVTGEEIMTVLRSCAPVSSHDLVSRFKHRLRTSENKAYFCAILRKISFLRKINGEKHIVLREEYK